MKTAGERMQWEPARADHSIDRALVSIRLAEPINPDLFDELTVEGRKAASKFALTHRVETVDPIEIQASEDGARAEIRLDRLPPANPRRIHFQRLEPDGGIAYEFAIGRQLITFATLRYRRWADFNDLMSNVWVAIEQAGLRGAGIKASRLEYQDRWASPVGGGEHFQVVSKDSPYLTSVVAAKGHALHVHSGWFDFLSDSIRQLTNVNIDVQDIPLDIPSDNKRKIRITTMREHEALSGSLDAPLERVDAIHKDLKDLYRSIITLAAAHRVGLE